MKKPFSALKTTDLNNVTGGAAPANWAKSAGSSWSAWNSGSSNAWATPTRWTGSWQ